MLKAAISEHANGRSPGRRRWALLAAGVVALFGSLMVTAPAQAGYYGEPDYGYHPCSYHCGYSPYRYGYYRPYRYGCSACGCYRRCSSGSGLVYERRYVEREYIERRYGCCQHRRHYGYYPYGGYRSGAFPYGYGGVRSWRAPYGYRRFGWDGGRYADGYEEPPRPPAPVWDGGYE
jgi:hypothetical protein